MKKIIFLFLCCCTMLFASINLNTASKQELMSLKGIGKAKAERIIEYRSKQPFKSVEELQNIKGFGKKLLEKLSSSLEV